MKNFDDILKNSKEDSTNRNLNESLQAIQEKEYFDTKKTKTKSKSKSKKSSTKLQKSLKEKNNIEKEITTV